ncbi:MAG: HD domain-containing protein [Lachnospiraceae bacterium]|nr:HD domain-containing protein [Lachnospiraceae bacterium]
MKMIACMALKPGMILADDVLSYKNELLLPKNTVIDEKAIAKLSRHSIMCVEIKEPEDLATTHFEKVRLSKGFKHFEEVYSQKVIIYKSIIDNMIGSKTPADMSVLFSIYSELTGCAKTGEMLLDYLYNMLPSEDDMTYSHCLNSALIAGVFGTWLGIPKTDLFTLINCGFFYDIGKLMIPQDIIWKPSKLTDIEYELVKTHTLHGFNILKNLPINDDIIKATLMHHERCDGTGYPSKLKEDQISQFAKYISIIDAYEAMTSARTYRKSLTPFEVIENFEKTERFYSSIILRPILYHIASSQMGMTVRLSNDETAEVILINQRYLSRPLVKCGENVIDLATRPDLAITTVL